MPAPRIWTIGHSTRTADEFIRRLRHAGIGAVADVRTIPQSKRHPHFGRDRLAASLDEAGVNYHHFGSLGGLRRPRADSSNSGWKNASFRGYADHMQTPEFSTAVDALLELAGSTPVAVMCAEALWWQCHRMLLADALAARGADVQHILSSGRVTLQPHRPTPFSRVRDDRSVWYPGVFDSPRNQTGGEGV